MRRRESRRVTGPTSEARAFTLLEVLAVTVLLSLILVAAITRASGAFAAARDSEARSLVEEVFARARLLARSGGAVVVSVVDGGTRLQIRRAAATGVGKPDLLSEAELPASVTISLRKQRFPVPSLAIDGAGRSDDMQLILKDDAGVRVLDVRGRTGEFVTGELVAEKPR